MPMTVAAKLLLNKGALVPLWLCLIGETKAELYLKYKTKILRSSLTNP